LHFSCLVLSCLVLSCLGRVVSCLCGSSCPRSRLDVYATVLLWSEQVRVHSGRARRADRSGGAKNAFCRATLLQPIILPRQARDRHRKRCEKRGDFCRRIPPLRRLSWIRSSSTRRPWRTRALRRRTSCAHPPSRRRLRRRFACCNCAERVSLLLVVGACRRRRLSSCGLQRQNMCRC
jgi:hypothetical protein